MPFVVLSKYFKNNRTNFSGSVGKMDIPKPTGLSMWCTQWSFFFQIYKKIKSVETNRKQIKFLTKSFPPSEIKTTRHVK